MMKTVENLKWQGNLTLSFSFFYAIIKKTGHIGGNMKKLFTLLLAIVLFALPACTQDPFQIEDDIIDSTQDIVIDFAAFVEERNAVHKASIEGKFTDEFFKTNGPDFYEDLDIVSEEEAEQLLNTPQADLLTHRLPEMPANLVPIIEEIWLAEVVGK